MQGAVRKLSYFDEKRLNAIAATAMDDYLKSIGTKMRQRHGNGWPGGTGSNSLSRRTGRGLFGLTTGRVVMQPSPLRGIITVPRYLANQEFGYVSTAKGKYLTIPLPAALNSDGTPKKRSARGWQNTFVVQGKRGTLTICTRRGRTIIPLYVLKPSIRVTARLGLRRVMRSEGKVFKTGLARRVRELFKAL